MADLVKRLRDLAHRADQACADWERDPTAELADEAADEIERRAAIEAAARKVAAAYAEAKGKYTTPVELWRALNELADVLAESKSEGPPADEDEPRLMVADLACGHTSLVSTYQTVGEQVGCPACPPGPLVGEAERRAITALRPLALSDDDDEEEKGR